MSNSDQHAYKTHNRGCLLISCYNNGIMFNVNKLLSLDHVYASLINFSIKLLIVLCKYNLF